jgi:hypothetical protein
MRLVILTVVMLSFPSLAGICQSPRDESDTRPNKPEEPQSPEIKKRFPRRVVWVSEYHFTTEEKRLLEPSTSDQQQVANILRLPDTRLIRLFPWARRRRIISVEDLGDGRSPDFNTNACIYSFSKERHGAGLNGYVDPRLGWAELKLGDGKFFAGFTGESLGVLVALGDIPLETVTAQAEGVRGLTDIIPPADYLEASALSKRNRAGFEMDRFSYGSSLPVAANRTYVLRSTSNKRADVLIGFRVIRLAPDGSVTIIWRKLKTYPKPEWKRREE